ncbi:hypothetical protein P873_13300 [Arenimonas composti TR7-09 = DSM 18010]|uniref:Calx-beta domain-containing protein n=2 Tax=Arenimonas TaxID=490567 RepID=A0A091BB87_9GAMM|nr:hypothetical protein P873_13300 [Arenimonas composti TR7-09 = DSM 18010]
MTGAAEAAIERHGPAFAPVSAAAGGANGPVPGVQGRTPIRLDRAALEAAVRAGELELPSSGATPLVAHDLAMRVRADGLRVITGRVDTRFGPQSVVLTIGDDVAFGTIPQFEGPALRLETRRGVTALVEGDDDLPVFATPTPDFALPPAPTPEGRAQRRRQEQAAAAEGSSPAAPGDPVIDVVVVYTPILVQLWGSVEAVHARIAHLEEITNQSYLDSDVRQNVRVVARHMVDYTVNNDNDDALYELTGAVVGKPESLPIRKEVLRLRDLYGADLVAMLRNFDRSSQNSCGVAWLAGTGGSAFTGDWGFSVTSDHGFANDNCGDWTFAHELGHNMGSHHDMETADGEPGAYAYSHGFRRTLSPSEGFATIMAYDTGPQVRIGRWSSPLHGDCMGQVCGNAADADNVRSLNNTRTMVAGITPSLPSTTLPELSIGDTSVVEGNSGQVDARFVISLSKPSATPVTVQLATMFGSAIGADFVQQTATVTISPGQTSVTHVVKVRGDTAVEVDEYFALNAISATGARIVDGQGIARIINDEPTPTLSMDDATVDEGNSGRRNAEFLVRLSAPSAMPVMFDFHTHEYAPGPTAATAGVDYELAEFTDVTIPAGATSVRVSVPVLGDTTVEEDERFYVMINNVRGAAVGDVFAVGRIRNDDGVPARPVISIAGADVVEGNAGTKTVTLPVTLSAPSTETVLFTAVSSNGTATAGSDYDQVAFNGQIPAGQTSASVSVTIRGDTVAEPDETFSVALVNIAGARLSGGSAVVRILDDDGGTPVPLLVPRDDHAVVLMNSPGATLDVLANDVLTASRFATGSLALSVAPARGTATIDTRGTASAADDRIVYRPNTDVATDDSFVYRLCESEGRCATATVTLVVRPHVGVSVGSDTGAGFADIALGGMPAMPDAQFAARGIFGLPPVEVELSADPTPESPWDLDGNGTYVAVHPVNAGHDRRVLVDARSLDAGDVDVYLGIDLDDDGVAEPGEVRCTAATATAVERCEMAIADGDRAWWLMLHARGPAQRARVEGFVYSDVAARNGPAVAATGPGRLAAGESFPVRVLWNRPEQAAGEAVYAMLEIGHPEGVSPVLVPVRIERAVIAATPLALEEREQRLQLVPGVRQDRLYIDIPPGTAALDFTVMAPDGRFDLTLMRVSDGWSSPHIAPAPVSGAQQYRWENQAGAVSMAIGDPTAGRWYLVVDNRSAQAHEITVSASVIGSGIAPAPRGSWFNPDRGGHGLLLYPAGGDWAGLWYTYFQDGSATWYYLQGPAPTGNGVWTGGLYRAAWNGSSHRLTAVGQAFVTPTADGMVFSYLLDGEYGSERLQPLGWGCPTLAGAPLDVSSHWFNPARAGTGYSVQMWENYEFYAAFVYDGRGVPRFLTAEAAPFAGADAVMALEQLRGFCPLCERSGAPARFDVGNLRRRFSGGSFAEIELDAIWTDGVPGAWTADEPVEPLGGPSSLQGCLPP